MSDARRAERIVLLAAVVGLGIGVLAPSTWASYPWVSSHLTFWALAVLAGPPLVAAVGAVLAHRYLERAPLWPVLVLDIIVFFAAPIGVLWGGGPGAMAALLLVAAACVLWAGRPQQRQLILWGVLCLCLSLFGTTGLVLYLVPSDWSPTVIASVLNLAAMVVLVRRAVVAGQSDESIHGDLLTPPGTPADRHVDR